MDKFKRELQEQVMQEIEASYAPQMVEAKAKDAKLPRGANGRMQTTHQAALESQMIQEEYKRLESSAIKRQVIAEERRLLQEYYRTQRIQVNPLTKVQK